MADRDTLPSGQAPPLWMQSVLAAALALLLGWLASKLVALWR